MTKIPGCNWTFEIVHVTPAMAEEWLKKNTLNRKLRDALSMVYTKAMNQDEWLLVPEPIVFVEPFYDEEAKIEREETLIEGQHRLTACVRSGKPQWFLVIRGCEPKVFTVMGQARQRSQADILSVTHRTMKNHAAVAGVVSSLLRFGIGMNQSTDAWMVRRVLDRVEGPILSVVKYKAKLKGLAKRPALAAIILAQLADASATAAMIEVVNTGMTANGSRASKANPAMVLREYLYEQLTSQKKDTPDNYFYKVCLCVAAWLDKEQAPRLKVDPTGLATLRERSKAKLGPVATDIFGKLPENFWTPKLANRTAAALS